MDEQTLHTILTHVVEHWGVWGFVVVVSGSMVAAAWAQIIMLRRWRPETVKIIMQGQEVIQQLRIIANQLGEQHASCTRHYDYAQRQIDGMESIGGELKAVVKSIAESDRERAREIMQLMTIIAGRHKA